MPDRTILIAPAAPSDLEIIRTFMLEYAAERKLDLSFQGFEGEVAGLPGAYAPPNGILLLARVDGAPLGSVAVRPDSPGVAELKRLYLRPGARGLGLGRRLVIAALHWSRTAGYRRIRLDTVPGMEVAQALYRSLDFHPIPPYRHNPIPGVQFFERDLAELPPE